MRASKFPADVAGGPTPRRFRIEVSEADLVDLEQRITRTRWADDFDNESWEFGTPAHQLRPLVERWATTFDWRAQEAAMNELDHFKVELNGLPIHFVWIRSGQPDAVPLVLSHGWPWTFWDFSRIIPLLTPPTGSAGSPPFDLVIPSLPGFAFSTPLRRAGVGAPETADLWAELMSLLGYDRFGAVGSDWGAHVTAHLAHAHADRLVGAYLTTCAVPGAEAPAATDFDEEEQEDAARARRRMKTARTHVRLNRDTPQTAAWALNDSPAGLLAMLIEKRETWSAAGRGLTDVFSPDFLLTSASLYWFTGCAHSAARFYASSLRQPFRPRHSRVPSLEAPVGIGIFPDEPFLLPRSVVASAANLVHWRRFAAGGHYAPMEEPVALAADIIAFFDEVGAARS